MIGARYTLRRQVFKIFGAGFHLFDPEGRIVGYCNQKAFRLKEDIKVYTGEDQGTLLLSIQARQRLDFSASYDVHDPQGRPVGVVRRKGVASLLRDSWEIAGPSERTVATLQEDSLGMALLRRFLDGLLPQRFAVKAVDGSQVAELRQRFNPFIYRLDVQLVTPRPDVPPELILAAAVLVACIEGRQS